MKVLSLTNEFEEEHFGGAGTAATGMLYMLDRLGVEQTVIVPQSDLLAPRWGMRGLGIKVLGLPRNSHYFGYLGMINIDVVRQEFPELTQEWDVIHCHAINFTPLAYYFSQGVTPILYTVYSFLRKELGDSQEFELQAQFKIQEDLLMRCQRVHLISQSEKSYLAGNFPQYLSKTVVLPLGISCPPERWQPRSTNELLYVGRLLNYKGIEDLILALSLVRQSGRQAHLNIIGKGPDDFETHLKRLVQLKKLSAWIKFHGWKPSSEVWRWMAMSSGLVVPSWRESFGLVALEGMMIGIPLIASRAGGLEELVPNSCAVTFKAGDVKQLSEALVTALERPSLSQSFARRAQEHAMSFDWRTLAPRYLSMLEQMKFNTI